MLLSQCGFEEKQKIDQSLLGSIFSMIAESGIEDEDETEETEENERPEMKEEKNEEMDDKNSIQNESEENHNDLIDNDEETTSSLRFGEIQKNQWNYILKDYENMKSIVIF